MAKNGTAFDNLTAPEVLSVASAAVASISQDGADFGELMSLRRNIQLKTEHKELVVDSKDIQPLIDRLEQMRSNDLVSRDDDLDYLRVAISTEIRNLIARLRGQKELAEAISRQELEDREAAQEEANARKGNGSNKNGEETDAEGEGSHQDDDDGAAAEQESMHSGEQNHQVMRREGGGQAVSYNQPASQHQLQQDRYYDQGATGPDVDHPDVLLDIPNVSVDEITLDVNNIRAHVSLDAKVAKLVQISAGVDASIDDVNLSIRGVRANALLIVRLDNVREILDSALSAIAENPMLINRLLDTVDNTVGTVGGVLNTTLQPGGVVSQVVDSLGRTVVQTVDKAGNIVERVVASGDD
jgi:hypothetical protein